MSVLQQAGRDHGGGHFHCSPDRARCCYDPGQGLQQSIVTSQSLVTIVTRY